MKIKSFLLIILLALLAACGNQKKELENVPQKKSDYSERWEKISSLEKKGMQRTAVQELNSILESAAEEQDYQSLFKALAIRSKYIQEIEEETADEIIQSFQLKIKEIQSPGKELLQSALAEIYLQYLQSNLWQIRDRTMRKEFDNEKISLMAEDEIKQTAKDLYINSLENSAELSEIPITSWGDIYNDREQDSNFLSKFTAYDFLLRRALNYFENEAQRNDALDRVARDTALFSPAEEFVQINWRDQSDGEYVSHWLDILSKALKAHMHDEDQEAFSYFNTTRLNAAFHYSSLTDKELFYRSSLHNALNSLKASYLRDDLRYMIASSFMMERDGVKAVETCSSCEDPNSYGGKKCKDLLYQIRSPKHSINSELVYPTAQPILFSYEYENLSKAYFKIIQLEKEEGRETHISEKYLRALLKKSPADSWSQELKSWNDYKSHRTELKIEGLKCGDYLLIASDREDFNIDSSFIASSYLNVSDIAYLERKLVDGSIIYLFKDRISGATLPRVTVEIFRSEYDPNSRTNKWIKESELESDKDGKVKIPSQTNPNTIGFNFKYKDQHLSPGNRIYLYRRDLQKNERKFTDLFTDRTIYRAGQTVYVKGVIYSSIQNEERVVRGEKSTIRVYDSRGEEIKSIDVITNNLGSFACSFKLPVDVINGRFRIANEFGSLNVRVEDYRRPSILVEFDSSDAQYSMGDSICVKGKILSYTRLPVQDADIEYKVIRRDLFFPEPMLSSYHPAQSSTIIKSGKQKLTESNFEICFQTSQTVWKRSSFTYELILSVTSPLGETIEKKKSFLIGKLPYGLSINSKTNLTVEELNRTIVSARDIYGKEVQKEGELQLWSLKAPERVLIEKYWPGPDHQLINESEFKSLFPLYPFLKSNLTSFEKLNMLSSSSFTSGESINSYRDLKEGAYLLVAHSITEHGDTITAKKYIRLYKKDKKKPPFPTFFWAEVVKDEIKEGEKILLQLNSSLMIKDLHVELEDRSGIVSSKKIELNNEKKWLSFESNGLEGELNLYISGISNNRSITKHIPIKLIPKEKPFELYLKTKRDYTTPGNKEEWSIGIKNLKDDQNIEIMASMYDLSLDQLEKQEWRPQQKWEKRTNYRWESGNNFGLSFSQGFKLNYRKYSSVSKGQLPYLNWFGFYMSRGGFPMPYFSSMQTEARPAMVLADDAQMKTAEGIQDSSNEVAKEAEGTEEKEIREDFKETVFFYPQLQNEGEKVVEIEFEMPDALTEWRFRALGHDEEHNYHQIDHKIISRKELMVQAYFPRFFRINDVSRILLEVKNSSDSIINGKMGMIIKNAENGRIIDVLEGDKEEAFYLSPQQSFRVSYGFKSPSQPMRLQYQIYAKGKNHTDIEEGYIFILPSSILITESLPFELRSGEVKNINFKELALRYDKVVDNRSYKVEYSSDPRWLAVYALPSMLKDQPNNPEMVFSSFFANAMGQHTMQKIENKNSIKQIFGDYAPKSQLEHNEDVAYLNVEQTPWISQSREEEEQRNKLADLFNSNQNKYEAERQLKLLQELQLENGAWPWFKGMRANQYITQYISGGLARLLDLKAVMVDGQQQLIEQMIVSSYAYLDIEIEKKFKKLQERGIEEGQDLLDANSIHYLYVRSFQKGWKPNSAATFYLQQAESYWQNKSPLLRAQIALTQLNINKNNDLSLQILASLKDNAIRDSLGVHWNFGKNSHFWHQSPIESQAYIIELFQKNNPNDADLENMRKWLLHQKKQQYWNGNTATAQATYAILSEESQILTSSEGSYIEVGGSPISPTQNEMPAFVSKSWSGNEVSAELSNIHITQNKNTFGWGAAYWQYYEQIDKIVEHSKKGLKINSTYYAYEINEKGQEVLVPIKEEELEVGDLVRQRTEVIIDFDLDFVFISDQPPACLEPTEMRSGMEYVEGIQFYINRKDTEKQWFIDHLPKGRYVFETDYRVSHSGSYAGGVSKLQAMYAAEFVAHTTAGRLKIK